MVEPDNIRSVVASFLGVDAGELRPEYPLGERLRNSIMRAGLQARLHRELGSMPPPLVDVATYGQLERCLLSPHQAVAAAAPAPAVEANGRQAPSPSSAGAGLSCGIDIEAVASLPEAADYWSHPFYKDTFSPTEIAECILGGEPREHFAARWCVKEALIKCDPAFRDVCLAGVEVRKDESGAPRLFDLTGERPRPLPVAVSLAHAGGFAAAIVVAGRPPATPCAPSVAPARTPAADPQPRLLPWISLAVGLAALVTAIGAWVR